MVLQGELAEDEQELLTPHGVVAGGDVEDDGDEAPDVLNRNSLGVQVQNGGRFVKQHGVVDVVDRLVVVLVRRRGGGWIGGISRCALLGSKEERLAKALGGGVMLLGCSVGELLGLGGAR